MRRVHDLDLSTRTTWFPRWSVDTFFLLSGAVADIF